MRLLLDTHAILWHTAKHPSLSTAAREAIVNPANQLFISVASLWEITIKVSLGKLTLKTPVSNVAKVYQGIGAVILPMTLDHALATGNLPWHHRDPFDRMLIAQAQYEGLTLVSRDSLFASYDLKIMW